MPLSRIPSRSSSACRWKYASVHKEPLNQYCGRDNLHTWLELSMNNFNSFTKSTMPLSPFPSWPRGNQPSPSGFFSFHMTLFTSLRASLHPNCEPPSTMTFGSASHLLFVQSSRVHSSFRVDYDFIFLRRTSVTFCS